MPRRRNREDDDNISLISMRELAPSPIDNDDTSSDDFPLPDSSEASFSIPARSSTLGGSTRGPAYYLYRTQKYSAYTFLTFLTIHGTTAAASPLLLGVPAGNASLLLARTYFYQASPIVESLLIPGALGVHITSGLGLRLYRHFQQKERYGGRAPDSISMWRWRNFSTLSKTGVVAVPGVMLHAGLLRGVPVIVDGDSSQVGLEYLAYGFWRGRWGWLVGSLFYAGFVGIVSYHVVYGLANYWKVGARRRKAAAAVGITAVWIGGLGRVVAGSGRMGGYVGRHYEKLYRAFFRRIEA